MDLTVHGGAMRLCDGALEGVNRDGTLAWRWVPSNARIIELIEVPTARDTIVLVEPMAPLPKSAPSLFRVRSDGVVQWQAEILPDGDGTYVAARVADGQLLANTWDGRSALIDMMTGEISQVTFTK